MTDVPVQRSDATPDQVEDPTLAAEQVVANPSRSGSPEWLAAKQLLTERSKEKGETFSELEQEMQAIRGMSEI